MYYTLKFLFWGVKRLFFLKIFSFRGFLSSQIPPLFKKEGFQYANT
ncbi:hypothetical protein HMPREF1409_00220 [Helicobacter pylori GAM246Ai]|nr:hypothetical protein HMPREF1409_00220 [Helicobacter pylori GAM246Ai]